MSVSRECTNSTKDNLHFNLVFFNLTILMKKSMSVREKSDRHRMHDARMKYLCLLNMCIFYT